MTPFKVLALSVLVVAGPMAALVWALNFKAKAGDAGRAEVIRRVEASHEIIDVHLEEAATMMSRMAALAAPLARVAMSTHPIEVPTVKDALGEIQAESHFDWVGLSTVNAEVVATATEQRLELDTDRLRELASTPLFRSALGGKSATALWFLKDQPMIVAAAPILRGNTSVGVLLVGRVVSRGLLEPAAHIVGGSVGLRGPQNQWFGSDAAPPVSDAVGRASRAFPETLITSIRPVQAPLEGVWVPLIIVGLVALAVLGSMAASKAGERSVSVERPI